MSRPATLCVILLLTLPLGRLSGSAPREAAANLEAQARKVLAVTSGSVAAPGLHQAVEVLRDRWGVAHIYARDQHDLFFAQGWVAAQDRLFQMELWKRSGQGRLAEVLGPSALLRDINARRLRYRGDMRAEYESYAPDTREILEAFTSGINAYIAEIKAAGRLPVEFQWAGFEPESWQPEDCLNRMAAFSMTGNSFSELLHAQMVSALGAGKASSLLDLDPAVALDPAPGLDLAGLSPALLANLAGSDVAIRFPAPAMESNNWTVSGALTQSGKPLLANDPHRVIAEPSLRYMVHLVAPGWDVIGAGEPGLPGVALGHNQHIAWGFTIFGLDQQDLYIERLNPSDPLQYKAESGWLRMQVVKEKFGIRGGPPVEVELAFTQHGPVLWSGRERALTLRWVGSEPGTAGYLGSLSVDRARSWQEFEAAMPRWKVPSENIVYADREGNIGEHSTGLAPLRQNWTGLLPVPGDGKHEWSGFLPNSSLPHFFNPGPGFIATANHRMIPDGYPFRVGYQWAPPYRIRRINQVLSSATGKLSMDDMRRLQNDVASLPARELVDLLRKAAGDSRSGDVGLMLAWDGQLSRESAAAALYEVWLPLLNGAVQERMLPAEVRTRLKSWSLSLPLLLQQLTAPAPEVFGTNPSLARDGLLLSTLGQAAESLERSLGTDRAQWQWGKLHTVQFRHALDELPGGALLFDRGPIPRPGDEYTVNATGFGGDFAQTSGASYREIIDLGDWDASLAINTPGQSGQPGGPHYSDLVDLWDQGKCFPLTYSRAAVEQQVAGRLQLQPR